MQTFSESQNIPCWRSMAVPILAQQTRPEPDIRNGLRRQGAASASTLDRIEGAFAAFSRET
jgi:hypothetical protein